MSNPDLLELAIDSGALATDVKLVTDEVVTIIKFTADELAEFASLIEAKQAERIAELEALLHEIRPMFNDGRATIVNKGSWVGGGIVTWFDRVDQALAKEE